MEIPIVDPNIEPKPYPDLIHRIDKWDEDHVRLPCSSANVLGNGVSRWDAVKIALSSQIRNPNEFENLILNFNLRGRWSFEGIKRNFFNLEIVTVLPNICQLALSLPNTITAPIPLLRKGINQSLTFSQRQIACLLANAFFCTFPRRNATGPATEYANFPIINFSRLYSEGPEKMTEKLKCLINYFKRIESARESHKCLVTYTRRSLQLKETPKWHSSKTKFCGLVVKTTGSIETEGIGMLQVRRLVHFCFTF